MEQKLPLKTKRCWKCNYDLPLNHFVKTKSIFHLDGKGPFCNECTKNFLVRNKFAWDKVDKLCQFLDIPFVPREWERIYKLSGEDSFPIYAAIFSGEEYSNLSWKEYYDEFLRLEKINKLNLELPEIREEHYDKLRKEFGGNYDEEALDYLDDLRKGLMATQNVNGKLQLDQVLKICKISYEIDCKIREGTEFDKLLSSYDKLIKAGDFTPKNVKNINDFDTMGEVIKWLEKKGWVNRFYDEKSRDIVDETIKNIQAFNQRLYINESGIGDEINRRIEALKTVKQMESYYEVDADHDLEQYEVDGFNKLYSDEEFIIDLEEDNG